IGNGFAIVRPPGHHSHSIHPQGYCIFNNVAIAAKYAVENLGLKKVLVVDIDYHCGNGTYQSLKNDERFLFVNFHAYHHGAFWPFESEYDYDSPVDIDYHCGNGTYQSLKNDERFLFVNFHAYHHGAFWPFESEYDYDSPVDIDYHCGNGTYQSLKNDERFLFVNFHAYHHGAFWPFESEYDYDSPANNHISIPLNASMNTEFDFMAAFQILVLPIAKEFEPELVLLSVGFDSAYGDQVVEIGNLGQAIKAHGSVANNHISIPLNASMNTEFDFMAAFQILVLPIAKEFEPELVLLSVGFDSAYGDQVVEIGNLGQAIKAHGYGHFARLLDKHWPNKILAVLEGGYLPESYRIPLPNISIEKSINTCMVQTIWNALCHHSKRWKSAATVISKLQQQQLNALIFSYGHFARLLDKHWPNKILAVLEGGYLPESYVECASQMTKGLQARFAAPATSFYSCADRTENKEHFKRIPLPNISIEKSINTCMVQTIWNALCHHSKRWKSAATVISKLQQQQVSEYLTTTMK
ncbi:unnamed protein product, partial [Toxocara canis]|uniref:Hist_deacetyl domain-containing protein n=1 Tax=Toxocara canis TaxID=6265 RepID=A0A183VB92_TOXCA